MKKLFYLFLLLPFTMLVSCSKDDFSPVDMTLTLSGVTQVNDHFYSVEGEDITIENLTVKALNGENCGLANVVYSLDGIPLLGTPGNPFLGTIPTENLPGPGTYSLNITGNLLEVGSAVKVFAVSYPITIVESAEDLPENAPEIGSYSYTITITED